MLANKLTQKRKMTDKEKKVIFTIVGVMLAILLIAICVKQFGKAEKEENKNTQTQNIQNEEKYVTNLSDGTKLNNSNELNKNKTYKTISISNIQFTSKNGNSVLLADITNTGSIKFEREEVTINILGENKEIIDSIAAVIPEIQAQGTGELNAMATADLVNARDIEIVAKK